MKPILSLFVRKLLLSFAFLRVVHKLNCLNRLQATYQSKPLGLKTSRKIDERYQSLNVEMAEVGGNFCSLMIKWNHQANNRKCLNGKWIY